MVAHTNNPSIWKIEERELGVQDQPIYLGASLGYMRPCL